MAANREGFKALQRLRDDWQAGVNRFSALGEAFYVARCDGALVGVCGLNCDPFAEDPRVGRLRRMYVHPQFRRMGIGRQLVLRAIEDGRGHFHTLRLRTVDEGASAFYKALGFDPVEGMEAATHQLVIESRIRMRHPPNFLFVGLQ
ncbi:MAG TPA: GNAT family N-acetyltransferase [Anaerolineales bacterium]|nr:GNAT family N-acetyltransferase [Anaerolineales bacterium]